MMEYLNHSAREQREDNIIDFPLPMLMQAMDHAFKALEPKPLEPATQRELDALERSYEEHVAQGRRLNRLVIQYQEQAIECFENASLIKAQMNGIRQGNAYVRQP